MDFTALAEFFENSGPGEWMRNSLKAMPFVEATHVLAIAVVFGTILIVDLRLLGYPNSDKSYKRLHHDLVRWTWAAFGIAVITGVLMFLPNATTYFRNTAFLYKMIAMALAGVNMAIFELSTSRTAASWDGAASMPLKARVAGGLSIFFWLCVIVFGRWIGFTKGYDFDIPDDVEFDFGFLPMLGISGLC
jgi:hypothetical protein